MFFAWDDLLSNENSFHLITENDKEKEDLN